jgi:hypothetical protein
MIYGIIDLANKQQHTTGEIKNLSVLWVIYGLQPASIRQLADVTWQKIARNW